MDKQYTILGCTIFLYIAFILFLYPRATYAEVRYENKIFSQSVILKQINQPYYFSGQNTIPKGVTVTVEKGTQVFIEGNIFVRGKLIFQGEKDLPIQIKRPTSSQSYQKLISLMGGELFAFHVKVEKTLGLLDAYATSSVFFDTVNVEDVGLQSGSSIITVFNNSLLSIKNSNFKDITTQQGIEVFNQSSLSITNSSFERVGSQKSIVVYDAQIYAQTPISVGATSTQQSIVRTNSTVSIVDSSFDGGLVTGQAIEIFNGAYAEIVLTRFEHFESAALNAFSSAQIEILDTVFSQNKKGIEAYNSSIKISESEIFGNTERGAVLYGGTVDATNNWWGSDTGPYNVSLNPSGVGDAYVGIGQINPWKTLKPRRKIKCCSSVLFIPGMQGSRIYKKGALSENQLWEPNTTADISKLYLTPEGYSADKNLYFRDIIDRTNVLFGGNDDVEIYKGLIQALNGLNYNYSIEDWQFSAYDWRMSPNSIVTEGTRYGGVGIGATEATGSHSGTTGQYKRMEEQIVQMAQVSKTGKVTIVTHSYGGLVSKMFLTHLAQKGKTGLIDKVIFVGVPENGSPASLFALLHGDNQDIGNGYIVNKFTMRKFAQNMPSVYALLPKTRPVAF
jgi:hypothetical protein